MLDPGSSREELLAALEERDVVTSVLLVRIADLERRVGMDSSNSSMPPGSDGPGARARRAKQRKKNPSPHPRGGGGRTRLPYQANPLNHLDEQLNPDTKPTPTSNDAPDPESDHDKT